MSKIRTAATAAACAIGITAGAIAMASPAAATGSGDALYDCWVAPNAPPNTPDYNDSYVAFDRDSSGHLTLITSISSPLPGITVTATTKLTVGGTVLDSNINSTSLDPVILEKNGSTATYSDAPDQVILSISNGATVDCRQLGQTQSGFPL